MVSGRKSEWPGRDPLPAQVGLPDAALAPGGSAAAPLEAALSAMLALPQISAAFPVAAIHRARSLEAFGRLAAGRPEAATALLSALFSMLPLLAEPSTSAGGVVLSQGAPVVTAPVAGGKGKENCALARQRVCTAVLGVCAAAGAALRPRLQELAERLGAMDLQGTERGALAEALVAVALAAGGGAGGGAVADVLRWLLGPIAARWAASPPGVSAAACVPVNWEVFHDLQMLDRCLRRCCTGGAAEAVAEHAAWSVPHALRLLAGVATAWTPAGRQQLGAALAPALAMPREEIAVYLQQRGAGGSEGGLDALVTPASPAAEELRGWLRGLRDSGYGLLAVAVAGAAGRDGGKAAGERPHSASPPRQGRKGGAAVSGSPSGGAGNAAGGGSAWVHPGGDESGGIGLAMYAAAGLPEAVAASLMSELGSMESRHVRGMLRTVLQPVVARCPAAHRARWLGALLPRLLPHMQQRLTTAWDALARGGRGGAADGSAAPGATSAEVVEERLLRDLTRTHLNLLATLAQLDAPPAPHGAASSGEVAPAGSGTRWWDMGESGALSAGLAVAIAALNWCHSDASLRGVTVCRAAVVVAAEAAAPAALRQLCGGEVLGAAMRSLTLNSNAAHQAEIIALIRDCILKLGPLCDGPRAVFCTLPAITPAACTQLFSEARRRQTRAIRT